MHAALEMSGVSIKTPNGRSLVAGLSLRMGKDHVALVGRNGVGKSTLLGVLAGASEADAGQVIRRGKSYFVPQASERDAPLSLGERRRRALEEACSSGADILLLDEPSEHLDEASVTWLRDWLAGWSGCLVVASHDRRLLAGFRHFFVVSEAGCRYFGGTLAELDAELERDHEHNEQRYVRNLNQLAAREEHTLHVARRKARKKRYGRVSELDRCNPKILLNKKRDNAQYSHGRLAKLREQRLASLRLWTQSTRRALNVSLSFDLFVPSLPTEVTSELAVLEGVSATSRGRVLFRDLDLRLERQRLAIIGPNGAGKTTLLELLIGRRRPESGTARALPSKLGYIQQGGANWLREESLSSSLSVLGMSAEGVAQRLIAHRFPLALAERPLCTLSPGERARAALICLFSREPSVEALVLDEPTFGLDLVGQRALVRALRAWPGGLVIASHDRSFLAEVGVERTIELAG